MFLLWELSTPFVYARWFLHKAGLSRTTAYKFNGVLMVLVFFFCRNVAGLGKPHVWPRAKAELALVMRLVGTLSMMSA